MSRDMHVYLEYFNNKKEKWEAVEVYGQSRCEYYEKEGIRALAFMEGGWSSFMDVLTEADWTMMPQMKGVKVLHNSNITKEECYKGLFKGLSVGTQMHFDGLFDENGKLETGYFGLGMVNVADIATYVAKYPKVPFEGSDEEIEEISNPFIGILDRINMLADMLDIWYDSYTDFRLVYWGDR